MREKLETVESAESMRMQHHDDWEPEWTHRLFHGVLRCAIPTCGEPVVVAGHYALQAVLTY